MATDSLLPVVRERILTVGCRGRGFKLKISFSQSVARPESVCKFIMSVPGPVAAVPSGN